MKTLEEWKSEKKIYQKYVYGGDTKNKKINKKLERGISQEYSS